MSTLSPQQRGILTVASMREWVSARMFAGAIKTWRNPRYREVTVSSAGAALRRLADRGLLRRHDVNAAIFYITDEGREALALGEVRMSDDVLSAAWTTPETCRVYEAMEAEVKRLRVRCADLEIANDRFRGLLREAYEVLDEVGAQILASEIHRALEGRD